MSLIDEIKHCELCLHGRAKPGQVQWALHEHQIIRGPLRKKSTGKRFATIVLCYWCHMERIHGNEDWPEARQLACLMKSRPRDYDLVAYNLLKVPNAPKRITQDEVDAWLARMSEWGAE